MSSENTEWISVSELARRKNCSTTKIYNDIRGGMYEVQKFYRGKMAGYVIKVNKDEQGTFGVTGK